jgi:hypothetical protein
MHEGQGEVMAVKTDIAILKPIKRFGCKYLISEDTL